MDEQSFQDLLSAAFTIQEHNDRRKGASPLQVELEAVAESETDAVCPHCGAIKRAGEPHCQNCLLDEFRPGERMQRNWASMWLKSQEQGLWPDRSAEVRENTREVPRKDLRQREAEHRPLAPAAPDVFGQELGKSPFDTLPINEALAKSKSTAESTDDLTREDWAGDSELAVQKFHLSANDALANQESSDAEGTCEATIDATTEATLEETLALPGASDARTNSLLQRLADLSVILRFHRADVYLGAAVCIAVLALLWPAASSPRRPALGLWERALITLGIAEAPTAAVHYQGDPTIEVWVDPHTALYYCPGEDQYGKTSDGRLSSQREAQMDRFEPAARAACE